MGSLFDDTVVFSSSSSFSSPLLSFPVPDYFDVLRPLHFPGSLAQTLQLEQSAFRVNPQKVLFCSAICWFVSARRKKKHQKNVKIKRGKKRSRSDMARPGQSSISAFGSLHRPHHASVYWALV
jgi:hypothetical protein